MINEQIRDREVRLIGPDGEQIGVVSSREAQKIADEAGLDLVKIAPNAKPPVCKVIDYGKYRYDLARKEKDAKKKQKPVELQEIRLSPNIDTNDLNTKMNAAKKFLAKGNKVKITLRFRGREMAHMNSSKHILDDLAEQLSDIAERMSNLDFDVKYHGKDKSEIGVLGNSMNNMSKKLEENISQLKSANKELQRDIDRKVKMEEVRTEFLSNVSHELKTPIALIQGYAEGLKEGISDDPESMDFYCGVIIDEAGKMNNMVKKLLTLNQIEFGNEELVMERFDIIELITSIVNANELRASQKGIQIEFNQRDEHIDVWSDEYKIEEVVTNYITNAINHCDFENRIEVSVERIGDDVRVHVFNTGKNIPEEDIPNIWQKFYKVDKARTREYGGNGIGLSIVKAIMDSYGKGFGVINKSNGVEFWFDLDGKAMV